METINFQMGSFRALKQLRAHDINISSPCIVYGKRVGVAAVNLGKWETVEEEEGGGHRDRGSILDRTPFCFVGPSLKTLAGIDL